MADVFTRSEVFDPIAEEMAMECDTRVKIEEVKIDSATTDSPRSVLEDEGEEVALPVEFEVKNGDALLISEAMTAEEEELLKARVKEEAETKKEIPADFLDPNFRYNKLDSSKPPGHWRPSLPPSAPRRHHLIDNETATNTPSRLYAHDRKAMAAAPADIKEVPYRANTAAGDDSIHPPVLESHLTDPRRQSRVSRWSYWGLGWEMAEPSPPLAVAVKENRVLKCAFAVSGIMGTLVTFSVANTDLESRGFTRGFTLKVKS